MSAKKQLGLTSNELQVMQLMVYGKTNPEMAELLGKHLRTVKHQVRSILAKLGAENRTHAVAKHLAPHLFQKKENP